MKNLPRFDHLAYLCGDKTMKSNPSFSLLYFFGLGLLIKALPPISRYLSDNSLYFLISKKAKDESNLALDIDRFVDNYLPFKNWATAN